MNDPHHFHFSEFTTWEHQHHEQLLRAVKSIAGLIIVGVLLALVIRSLNDGVTNWNQPVMSQASGTTGNPIGAVSVVAPQDAIEYFPSRYAIQAPDIEEPIDQF